MESRIGIQAAPALNGGAGTPGQSHRRAPSRPAGDAPPGPAGDAPPRDASDAPLRGSLRPPGPVRFDLSVRRLPGLTVLRLEGELDILTAPKLGAALDEAIRSGEGDVVVDLRGAAFIDSVGLHVLLNARRRLARVSRGFAVLCEEGTVRKVIELARLTETLGVACSLDERTGGRQAPSGGR